MTEDEDRDPVDEVAEDYAVRLRRGEQPVVDDYLRKYPDHADELRDVLPAVEMLERAKLRRESQQEDTAPPPDRLGDFRIEREVGRGGMGIVYEAQQESLNRRVALKVLPAPVRNDESRRRRFDREARIAASLHHTNIVPIFGVGEEDDRPYIVMQLIEGSGLNEVIATLRERVYRESVGAIQRVDDSLGEDGSVGAFSAPKGRAYWRFVARVGLQVADALAYAHERGAVHRDIKPSNLLLDAKGTAWLADFGIAKIEHQPELTESGDLIGTTRYIAPEALAGEASPRSDQYGLGVTLYEMATLEPAFGSSRTAELLDRIRAGSAPRAASRNSDIPRDLETVIEKAMSHQPAHRYEDASALADDLRCFLEDRPVCARRVGAPERLVRWCRRNQVLASLGMVAVASLVIAAVTGWTAYVQKRDALLLESGRLRQVAEAEASARANFELSLGALEGIFDALAPDESMTPRRMGGPRRPVGGRGPAGPGPGGGPEGAGGPEGMGQRKTVEEADLFQSILGFYESFATLNSTDTGLRREAARAYRRAAEIQRRLSSSAPDAVFAEQRALDLYEALVDQLPDDRALRVEYLDTAGRIGMDDLEDETLPSVVPKLAKAIRLGVDLEESSDDSFSRTLLARAMIRAGGGYARMGEPAKHETMLRDAISVLEIPAKGPADRDRIIELGLARHALALKQLADGDIEAAAETVAKAIDQLDAPGPGHPRELFARADLYWTLAEVQEAQGDEVSADASATEALQLEKRARGKIGRGPPRPGGGRRGPGGQ